MLARAAAWLRPGGALLVKVPNGAAQRLKETVRGKVRPGYRPEQDRVEIVLSSPARDRLSGAVDRLCQVEGVREAKLLLAPARVGSA